MAATFHDDDLLIQARIYDADYNFWQNAHDLLQYEANNHSYEHLPLVSNGLPFPLEQEIVDTSFNPGRCELKLPETDTPFFTDEAGSGEL